MQTYDAQIHIFEEPSESIRNSPVALFDRDNTLIVDAGKSNKIHELIWLPSAMEALSLLTKKGFRLAVCTNQSGLSANLYTDSNLYDFHRQMNQELIKATGCNFLAFAYCPHSRNQSCTCRKPQNGQILRISDFYKCSPQVFFGDSESDLQAASASSIHGVLVAPGELFKEVEDWIHSDYYKSSTED